MTLPRAFRIAVTPCMIRRSRQKVLRHDAFDVGEATMRAIETAGCPCALYVYPDLRVEIYPAHTRSAIATDRAPLSLVGIYTRNASAREIADDVLALRGAE